MTAGEPRKRRQRHTDTPAEIRGYKQLLDDGIIIQEKIRGKEKTASGGLMNRPQRQ